MDTLRDFHVPPDSLAISWLGQNGYIFKSPEGTTLGVDLYLTDSCATLRKDLDLHRRFPVLIEPEELQIDLFACTHNHQDHTDPWTLRRLSAKDRMQFIGPPPSCEVFRGEGIAESRITMMWPGREFRFRDLRLLATFSQPTDDTDLNHLGYIIRFGGGPKVYVTGDTAFTELLYSNAKHSPDAMIVCINGGFNNLSHWQAAEVAGRIRPKIAIPCHYDLFPDNSVDPRQFRAAMMVRAPGVRYVELEHGNPFVLRLN